MVPILRSVISRSVVRRRSFSTAAPTNTNGRKRSITLSALKEKFSVPWYIGPLAGLGVGYGLGMIIFGDFVAEREADRLKKLRETRGESAKFVDLKDRMWTGVSNRSAVWRLLLFSKVGDTPSIHSNPPCPFLSLP